MPLLNLSISQLLWFIVATNLLKKIKGSIFFLKWLTSKGLTCFGVPEISDLEKLRDKNSSRAKKNHSKSSKGRRAVENRLQETNNHDLKIKSADLIKLDLKTVRVTPWNLQITVYGEEMEWVVDFACMSIASFLLTHVLLYYANRIQECNYSIIWILMVILQCLLTLLELTWVYFRNKDSIGERSVCIVSGCIFLLLAMLIISFDGSRLDIGINKAFQTWSHGFTARDLGEPLLDPSEIDVPPEKPTILAPKSSIVANLLIALVCSVIGVLFTFPGFRFGQLHEKQMSNNDTSPIQRVIHNINYLSPLIVVCLWIPAISRDLLRHQSYMEIDDNKFELIRMGIAILANMLRFALVRRYTGTFLESASDRVERLRYKGGTTTGREVRLMIASINNYVNVVSLQYILPTLICLFSSIMYYAFHQSYTRNLSAYETSDIREMFGDKPFVASIEKILLPLWMFFDSDIPKNMSSFATWWFHFAWLCTSTVGLVYNKYFTL